jgi:phosphonoacetate hydrolase
MVNGVSYRVPAAGSPPLVGICLDGSAEEYLLAARSAGAMPRLSALLNEHRGEAGLVTAVMPTFTNPNNVSIVTGAPPRVTGISGNYFLDPASGAEVMMNDSKFLRCDTILAALSRRGVRVGVVTAKHKLLALLSHGLGDGAVALSVEKAATLSAADPRFSDLREFLTQQMPDIYSADISVACLRAGVELVRHHQTRPERRERPLVLYLSTTDYVQHKHAPASPEAIRFYGEIDRALGELDALGAVFAFTADHGMNDKVNFDGSPRVVMLEDLLGEKLPTVRCRVILPITDPYVVHHGGLGSYATVYVEPASRESVSAVLRELRQVPGVYTALDRNEAERTFELPGDRIGDVVVVADQSTVLGKSRAFHDLGQVQGLRSHGGLEEAKVPFCINRPLQHSFSKRLTRGKARNFHLFDFLLNGVAADGRPSGHAKTAAAIAAHERVP